MRRHLIIASFLAASTVCQEQSKGTPTPRHFEPDTKTGPLEPYVPAPFPVRSARNHGRAAKPVLPGAGAVQDAFADANTVLFDRARDGTVWASAASYKVGFAAGRVEFIPFLGSDAPRNYPVTFRLAEVVVDGQALAYRADPEPARADRMISFDRGSLVERYELTGKGMEQSFVFHTLARRGAITIRVAVDSTMPVAETAADDIAFANELGQVTYGRAFVLDAGGRRQEVQRRWTTHGIEITVPARFVADAVLPLVVDPLVGASTPIHNQSDGRALRSPDITYDATVDRYMLCYELVFSASDSDVFCYEISNTGGVATGQFVVDNSGSESWQAPRIANNNLANRYLVVAQVSAGGVSPFSIRGRTQNAGSTLQGNKFVIATPAVADVGDKIRPDVAGDPHTFGPTYFTVVWERVLNSSDHDIHARQVTSALDPSLLGPGTVLIDNAGTYEEQPQISNSMGAPAPHAGPQKALIVFKRRSNGSEIRGRLMRWNGDLDPAFVVSTGLALQDNPSASAVALPDGAGNYLYLVAWEQGFINDGGDTNDIKVVLCSQPGQVVSNVVNLQQIETDPTYSGFASWDQFGPRVATDGCRFAVAYNEDFQNGGDLDARITTLHPVPVSATRWTIRVTESRAWPASRTTVERGISIVSRYECAADNGTPPTFTRYGLTWADANGTSADQIRAQVYDGMTSGGGVSIVGTGCGGVGIAFSGTPALGERFQVTTSSATGILFGVPQTPALPICGGSTCRLGVTNYVALPAQIALNLPCNVFLIGGTVAFQGFTWAGGPCFGALAVSDTLIVRVR